jgi:hypothetical protein
MSTEYCLVSDEGVVEDGFFSMQAALDALAKSDPDDELEVAEREQYDEDGQWIEEADDDSDDDDSDDSDDEE